MIAKKQFPIHQLLSMKDTEKVLKEELSKHFAGQSQRLTMLTKLILGILKLGTVSYSKLCLVINPSVQKDSNFKRIQRFVKGFNFCQKCYIQLVWKLFVLPNQWVALSVDRTNWKFGKCNINILLIGISYKGTAIPLIWVLLDKRGNSSTQERISLMNKLLNQLTAKQHQQIKCLLADREFIGKEWISYLKSMSFTFVIRIRNNSLMRKIGKLKEVKVGDYFSQNYFKALRKPRILFGHRLYIGGQKINDTDWLILISDLPISQGKRFYGERWGIEVFFGSCKTRGFNFEDTHVTKPERLFNLIFLIALAFIWALKTGELLIKKGYQIPIKNLKTRKTKLFSTFRVGLDYLKERLLNFLCVFREIQLLYCT